ncbi:hypothetical protein H8356DRAFT_1353547 [Neocallimastix lanati (nom. inval.)]|nr:hypothetical protein H8356DRAFT_1353547 [Neocallimastix sp. JGI-2020a]
MITPTGGVNGSYSDARGQWRYMQKCGGLYWYTSISHLTVISAMIIMGDVEDEKVNKNIKLTYRKYCNG